MQISVLIPSIRRELLEGVYNSIATSFHGEWELVVVGPYPLPGSLMDKLNVVWRQDWGSPIRCRQIALLAARGEYVCYAADDCTFFPDALDKAYAALNGLDVNVVALGKYSEGAIANPVTMADEYYKFRYHKPHDKLMDRMGKDYWFVNTGLIQRKFLMRLGGFDCRFEACAMACCDLSIRLQNAGAVIKVLPDPIFHSTHLPMHEGDHGPVHDGQMETDMPLFEKIYADPQNYGRENISLETWKDCPERWERRFGRA